MPVLPARARDALVARSRGPRFPVPQGRKTLPRRPSHPHAATVVSLPRRPEHRPRDARVGRHRPLSRRHVRRRHDSPRGSRPRGHRLGLGRRRAAPEPRLASEAFARGRSAARALQLRSVALLPPRARDAVRAAARVHPAQRRQEQPQPAAVRRSLGQDAGALSGRPEHRRVDVRVGGDLRLLGRHLRGLRGNQPPSSQDRQGTEPTLGVLGVLEVHSCVLTSRARASSSAPRRRPRGRARCAADRGSRAPEPGRATSRTRPSARR